LHPPSYLYIFTVLMTELIHQLHLKVATLEKQIADAEVHKYNELHAHEIVSKVTAEINTEKYTNLVNDSIKDNLPNKYIDLFIELQNDAKKEKINIELNIQKYNRLHKQALIKKKLIDDEYDFCKSSIDEINKPNWSDADIEAEERREEQYEKYEKHQQFLASFNEKDSYIDDIYQ
jgi:hypothetical protein